jgi:hypothetical protein
MHADGFVTDHEILGDLAVRASSHEVGEDFSLAICEVGERSTRLNMVLRGCRLAKVGTGYARKCFNVALQWYGVEFAGGAVCLPQ